MEKKSTQKRQSSKSAIRSASGSRPKANARSGSTGNNNLRKNRKKRQRQRKSSGCLAFIIGVVIVGFLIYLVAHQFSNWADNTWSDLLQRRVTQEVYDYEPEVSEVARSYDIEEYTNVLLAIMMQESKGRGDDPMQSSECVYNTAYEQTPGGIEDPHYSIDCGVRYFADCLSDADCDSPNDTDALQLAIQGYNYGTGYIHWALENYGYYSLENAAEFSDMMAEELGMSGYGDKTYVTSVMNFYDQILNRTED